MHGRSKTALNNEPRPCSSTLEAAIAATGTYVVIVSEGLSLFSALTPAAVRIAWGLWLAAVVVILAGRPRRVACWIRLEARAVRATAPATRIVLFGLAAIVVLTGLTAWFAAPNTSDSMAYHMSRTANWAQQRSVADYATPTLLQLYQPPWAEFVILQLQLIVGSDRLANLVQWASMLGCVVMASIVTRRLGGGARSQMLAGVFVATLPMGILQASSTQNDYVAAFWVIASAASALLIWESLDTPDWRHYVIAGACFGLALCTKGTSYFFVAPLGLLLLVIHVRRWRSMRTILFGVLLVASALLVNVGQFSRNIALFGSPLGPVTEEANGAGYQVSAITWNGVVSNLVRNIGMQLATPSDAVNQAVFDDISYLHEKMDIWLGAAATSWPDSTFERSTVTLTTHESTAANTLGLLLLFISSVLGSTSGVFKRNRRLLAYALAWGGGFLLFSAILRWQPWGPRLVLPWFVLGAPIVPLVLSQRPRARAWVGVVAAAAICAIPLALQRWQSASPRQIASGLAIVAVIGALVTLVAGHPAPRLINGQLVERLVVHGWTILCLALLVAALPWLLFNETRPLVGPESVLLTPREQQYFVVLPELRRPYESAAAGVRRSGCSNVGLMLGPRDWDYPFWVLVGGGRTPSVLNINYLNVGNASARLADPTSGPCAIVSTVSHGQAQVVVNGQSYARVADVGSTDQPYVDVFLRS